jgi:hypothetical protein
LKVIKFIVIFFLLTLNINNSKVYCQEVKNDSITNQEDNLLYVIDKKANDSINIDINKKKILLYGKAEINYNGIKIESGFIEIDWNNNIIAPAYLLTDQFLQKILLLLQLMRSNII